MHKNWNFISIKKSNYIEFIIAKTRSFPLETEKTIDVDKVLPSVIEYVQQTIDYFRCVSIYRSFWRVGVWHYVLPLKIFLQLHQQEISWNFPCYLNVFSHYAKIFSHILVLKGINSLLNSHSNHVKLQSYLTEKLIFWPTYGRDLTLIVHGQSKLQWNKVGA